MNRVTAVHSGRETPGPIPNPEAKPASADDTTQPGWKSRTPPNTHKEMPPKQLGGISICWSASLGQLEIKFHKAASSTISQRIAFDVYRTNYSIAFGIVALGSGISLHAQFDRVPRPMPGPPGRLEAPIASAAIAAIRMIIVPFQSSDCLLPIVPGDQQ